MDAVQSEAVATQRVHHLLSETKTNAHDNAVIYAYEQRLSEEMDAVVRLAMYRDIALLFDIIHWMKENTQPYCLSSSTGASFLLYQLGLSNCNPLSIPWQTVWGVGSHQPFLTVDVSKNLEPELLVVYQRLQEQSIQSEITKDQSGKIVEIVLSNLVFCLRLDDRSAPQSYCRCEGSDESVPLVPTVYREDVYAYLLSHGFSEEDAWRGMEQVRKGKGISYVTDEMKAAEDNSQLSRLERVTYLPSKAEAMEWEFYSNNRI